jgi:hypothetical protein
MAPEVAVKWELVQTAPGAVIHSADEVLAAQLGTWVTVKLEFVALTT